MLQRIECKNREEWLNQRQQQGLGGSEAAAAVGMSPWASPVELWKLKLGMSKPKDLSDNPAIQQGIRMEAVLRDFFKATHPEFEIWHHPFDILYQSERPWLFSTLDGEILDENGRYGVLEIKTGTPNGKTGWEQWSNGKMPQHYFIQCCHELLATGFQFVRLFACLYAQNGDMTLKPYEIERSEVEEDLAWLLREEERFYGYIQRGEMPPQPLIL